MAIVQISKIQQRRGLQQDLPQLAAGEIGWSIDARRIYIGNGTLDEGAPVEGRTEILTEFSVTNFTNELTANVASLQSNVAILQGNVVTINAEIAALQAGTLSSNVVTLNSGTSGSIIGLTPSNGVINYSLVQGSTIRSGAVKYSFSNSTVSYDEEYSQDASSSVQLSMTANSSYASLNYNNTGVTSTFTYRIQSI
jgi:Major tropism determinant N-terminal domain